MPPIARVPAADIIAMHEAGVRRQEIARQLHVSTSYVGQVMRRVSREGMYSAEGAPIGYEQADLLDRDRSRQAVRRELELLRAHASLPAYG